MNLRLLALAVLIVAAAGMTEASAKTYEFSYTGPDAFTFMVSDPSTGGTGYMGGPAQIYPSAESGANFPAANGVDWVDFYAGGTTLQFGEGNATGIALVASSPFFMVTPLTGPESGRYEVTFPGLSSSTIALSSSPGNGVLTVTSVPEPATWALMLLGFAAMGFAGYRRTARVATTLIGV